MLTVFVLQESALQALRDAAENFERPAFPCALIAGDVVILNLLDKLGYLSSGKVPVIFIDTFHLFSETHELMHRLEVCPALTDMVSVTTVRHHPQLIVHHACTSQKSFRSERCVPGE